MARKSVIAVVTEGASRPLLDRWCAAGLLPNFRRLFDGGTTGALQSDGVPYEVPGLVSAFTGYRPGSHGWLSYWKGQHCSQVPELWEPQELRVPFLWRRNEFEGRQFGIVNLFGTHPPAPVPGWLVSYPMGATLNASYPRTLMRELSEQGISYAHDVSIWYSGQTRENFLARVLEADRQRVKVGLELLRRGADVLLVNLTSIDRVCHFYWQELEDGSPFADQDTAIFQAFSVCDEALGEFMKHVDDRTSLIAFSEIGFGPLRAFCSVNRALADAGLYSAGPDPSKQTIRWEDTLAFEAVQGTHGVNINLKGRQLNGCVPPDEYEATRRLVCDALLRAINPHTGCALFKRVLLREELYAGKGLELAPDLIVEPADERYLPLGDPFWATRVNRTLQSGWHRADSYFGAMGPAFKSGAVVNRTVLPVDVAGAVYRALEIEQPDDIESRSLE